MRLVWLLIGIIALGLGAFGVLLPLLPTTPFVLVAAFAFAKSSKRLHTWLLNHSTFGPLIANWNQYGAISRPAKIVSLLSIAAVLVISIVFAVPVHALVIQVVVLSASSAFIITRPEPPPDDLDQ